MWFKRFAVILLVICASYGRAPYPRPDGTRDEYRDYWYKIGQDNIRRVLKMSSPQNTEKIRAKNVIIFVGDGMGMATITASRVFKGQRQQGVSGEEGVLVFEDFPSIGLSKTYNVDRQVPDSAGTATAMFCGSKTIYKRIGMDASNASLTSILHWFQESGAKTGLVTTTSVTHATPAPLYASLPFRDYECDAKIPPDKKSTLKDIARQLVENVPGNKINVILGGGRFMMGAAKKSDYIIDPMFIGEFEKTCRRNDSRNLVENWLELSVANDTRKYVTTTEELLAINPKTTTHLLGLFSGNHLPFNLVRDKSKNGPPSIAQMTKTAIEILSKNKSTGFFLMVEGGRIDHGHHQNQPQIAFDEVLEFEQAIKVALNSTSREDTLIIVTADHSHAMTMNGYPMRGNDILDFGNADQPYETISYANGPGFYDHRVWDLSANINNTIHNTWINPEKLLNRSEPNYRHMAALPLGDETHGGEDVPVYAIGPGAELIRGAFEQPYIAHVMSYAACVGPSAYLNPTCTSSATCIHYGGLYSPAFCLTIFLTLVIKFVF